ncbi:UNVERIFIED_CONTAM: hypothetical protein NCL1_47890 [Trichonephila clavipes]
MFTDAINSAHTLASKPIVNKHHHYTPQHIKDLIRQKNRARKYRKLVKNVKSPLTSRDYLSETRYLASLLSTVSVQLCAEKRFQIVRKQYLFLKMATEKWLLSKKMILMKHNFGCGAANMQVLISFQKPVIQYLHTFSTMPMFKKTL